MGTPFEDEFDIEGELDEHSIDVDDINASELTKLSEIKMYAMMGFKMTMSQMGQVSGDKMVKMHEIAQKYLSEAKDAEFKAKKLKIDLQRAQNSSKVQTPAKGNQQNPDAGDANSTSMSRNALYDLPVDDKSTKLPN